MVNRTDDLIQELVASTMKLNKDPEEILKEMERERREMEEMFTIQAGEAERLRGQEVLRNERNEWLIFLMFSLG